MWLGGEEMLAVVGEGGEERLALVGVQMRLWWLKCGWSKITIAKEKYYLKDHSPGTRIIAL